MPKKTPNSPATKLTLPQVLTYAVAAIAIVIVMRFVFSIAMSIMKFVILGLVLMFVVWVFLSKNGSGKSDG